MCCFSSCVKGYICMGWIFSSIFFSILVTGLFIAIGAALGSPFPTDNWDTGAKIVYASTFFTIVSSIMMFLVIVTFSKKISGSNFVIRCVVCGVTNAALALAIFLVLPALIKISSRITSQDVISYSENYRKNHDGKVPPAINTMERVSSLLKQDGIPLGCCGYKDFNDYIPDVAKLNCTKRSNTNYKEGTAVKFNAFKTCCKDEGCKDEDLKGNYYLSYDIQLFIYKLFNVDAKDFKTFDEVKAHSNKLGREFSDWISGEKDNKTKKFEEYELPPPDAKITYKPHLDCPYPLKARMKEHLGNWDVKNEWNNVNGSSPVKNKNNAGDNYVKSVEKDVYTNVLGCGELLQLILDGNKFVELTFQFLGVGYIYKIVLAFHPIVKAFMYIFLFHVILNCVWFNYYYIPSILFPGKGNALPFFPKKNKVLPTTQPSTTSQMPPVRPSQVKQAPVEAVAEAEAEEVPVD